MLLFPLCCYLNSGGQNHTQLICKYRSWPLKWGLFYNERIDVGSTGVKGHITESTCPLVDNIQNCAGGHTSVKTSLEASHSLKRVF